MENVDMNLENLIEDEIQEAEMERIEMNQVEIPENSEQYWMASARREIEDAINQIRGEQPEPINEEPEEFDIEITLEFRSGNTDPDL